MTYEEFEENAKEFRCNQCGNCYKGLPCPQDEKIFNLWNEYYSSKQEIDEPLTMVRRKFPDL